MQIARKGRIPVAKSATRNVASEEKAGHEAIKIFIFSPDLA